MIVYRRRHYTDLANKIVPLRVKASTAFAPQLIAEQERDWFAASPFAASIDAVDATYLRARIAWPDAHFRDRAIDEHFAQRPSFALRPNGPAGTALTAVYAGEDLADFVATRARATIGNAMHKSFAERLTHHAALILPALVPVNDEADRLLGRALTRIEAMQVEPRRARSAA